MPTPHRSDSLTVRIAQPHVRFGDPHVTSDDPSRLSIHACLFEFLVRRAPGGRFRSELASAWQLSDDARRWRLTLAGPRAHDAVFSLRRVRDERIVGELGTSGVFQAYLQGARIEARGPLELLIETPEPFADLLDLLVDIPITTEELKGTGRYRLEDSTEGRVILRRRALDSIPETLEFVAVPDADERASGGYDIAADVSPQAGNVQSPTTVCTSFICNLAKGPSTSPAFRQALNYAVDVQAIVQDVLGGAATPLLGPLTSRHLGFDPDTPGFGYQPEQARKLIELAGLTGTALTLDVPTVWPDEAVAVGGRVLDYLDAVGLSATLAIHADRPAYAMMVREKRIHDAACFDSSPSSTFRVLWEKFHSRHAGPWWQGFADSRLDGLVDEARAEPEVEQRAQLYRKAFQLLSAKAPWIFLYTPSRSFRVADHLAGWTPSPDGFAVFH